MLTLIFQKKQLSKHVCIQKADDSLIITVNSSEMWKLVGWTWNKMAVDGCKSLMSDLHMAVIDNAALVVTQALGCRKYGF